MDSNFDTDVGRRADVRGFGCGEREHGVSGRHDERQAQQSVYRVVLRRTRHARHVVWARSHRNEAFRLRAVVPSRVKDTSVTTLEQLKELTILQAEDDALWAPARTIDHAYCQQALRYLTNAIEGDWTFEQARDAIREMMP